MLGLSVHRPLAVHFPEFGIAVLESHHARDFRMEMQSARYGKVIHPLCGRGWVQFKTRREPLDRQAVWYLPPGLRHALADRPGDPMTVMVVCFRPNVVPSPLAPSWLESGSICCRKAAVVVEFRRTLRAMFLEQSLKLPGHGAVLVARTLELVVLLQRVRAIPPGRSPESAEFSRRGVLARVAAYLQADTARHLEATSTDSEADRLQISRRSFTSAVRELTGKSWLPWLRERRIAHAQTLLKATDRSVAAIAFECGFEDLSSFYRAFKRLAGLSPERWRKRAKNPGPTSR